MDHQIDNNKKTQDSQQHQMHLNDQLREAVRQGSTHDVLRLVGLGANVNACDTNQHTSLHLAGSIGNFDMINILLKNGANPLALNKDKQSYINLALLAAARRGDTRAVLKSLNLGADIHACDTNKQTPLHLAALFGRLDVVKVLLAHKANVLIRDKNYQDPSDLAMSKGHQEITYLLRNHYSKTYSINRSLLESLGSYEKDQCHQRKELPRPATTQASNLATIEVPQTTADRLVKLHRFCHVYGFHPQNTNSAPVAQERKQIGIDYSGCVDLSFKS